MTTDEFRELLKTDRKEALRRFWWEWVNANEMHMVDALIALCDSGGWSPRIVIDRDEDLVDVYANMTEYDPDDEIFTCRECGGPMRVEFDGVSHHLTDDSADSPIDYDRDADHVAITATDEIETP